jgi:hypothetical protein
MITVFNQSETGRSRVLIVGSWRDSCACDRVMSAGAAIAGHSREEFCGQHAVHFLVCVCATAAMTLMSSSIGNSSFDGPRAEV